MSNGCYGEQQTKYLVATDRELIKVISIIVIEDTGAASVLRVQLKSTHPKLGAV